MRELKAGIQADTWKRAAYWLVSQLLFQLSYLSYTSQDQLLRDGTGLMSYSLPLKSLIKKKVPTGQSDGIFSVEVPSFPMILVCITSTVWVLPVFCTLLA